MLEILFTIFIGVFAVVSAAVGAGYSSGNNKNPHGPNNGYSIAKKLSDYEIHEIKRIVELEKDMKVIESSHKVNEYFEKSKGKESPDEIWAAINKLRVQ